jgi:hypothetical protein
MGDFEDKLESILNNPQAMSQIMSLAQSLGGSGDNQTPSSEPEPAVTHPDKSQFPLDGRLLGLLSTLFTQYSNHDDQRVALLNSLRPFVKERRYAKLDKAIQIAKLSRMARMALDLLKTKEETDV